MARKPKPVEHYDDLKAKSGWYLAAWRDFKGVSGGDLAASMGTSKGQISDLENGAINSKGVQTRYNRDWLEKACEALEVEAGDLLDTNPFRDSPRFAWIRRAYPGLSDGDIEVLSDTADAMMRRRKA